MNENCRLCLGGIDTQKTCLSTCLLCCESVGLVLAQKERDGGWACRIARRGQPINHDLLASVSQPTNYISDSLYTRMPPTSH